LLFLQYGFLFLVEFYVYIVLYHKEREIKKAPAAEHRRYRKPGPQVRPENEAPWSHRCRNVLSPGCVPPDEWGRKDGF
jgi:hypothetical protein